MDWDRSCSSTLLVLRERTDVLDPAGNIIVSIGMRTSCIGASLLSSTVSVTTPDPNDDRMWNH